MQIGTALSQVIETRGIRKAVQLTDNPTAEASIDVVDDLLTYVKGNSKETDV